jgi:hypothetical protein
MRVQMRVAPQVPRPARAASRNAGCPAGDRPASAALGPDNARVLKLRTRRAAILLLGGDYRHALSEFDTLAGAYARTAGPTSPQALDCLRQAAHCRAALVDGPDRDDTREVTDLLTRLRIARSARTDPERRTD